MLTEGENMTTQNMVECITEEADYTNEWPPHTSSASPYIARPIVLVEGLSTHLRT